jgi:lysozyme
METLIDEIKRQEAYRSHAYRDTKDVLTIGYGLNLDDGISEPLAAQILEWIVDERRQTLSKLLGCWPGLTQARQDVFIDMAYNLGIPKFFNFSKMILAANMGDVAGVCREMRDSKWFSDVGNRAVELIEKYRKG